MSVMVWKRLVAGLGVGMLVLGTAGTGMAQGGDASIVVPELVAGTASVKPGSKFLVGVRFKVQDNWHIYWKNPGSSGLPTKVSWSLPKGLKAGEVQYPAPEAFEAPGELISFGYDHEVLLFSEVEADASLKEGEELEIKAKTSWLMCSDRCVPGKKDVSLKLKVGAGEKANGDLFGRYQGLVPKAGALPGNVAFKEEGAAGGKKSFSLEITPAKGSQLVAEDRLPALRKAYFFPSQQKGFVIEPPKVVGKSSAVDAGGKQVKAYEGPVKLEWTSEPESPGEKAAAKAGGVLVMQSISNGKPGKPTLLEVSLPAGSAR